jgi:DNA-binding MarR family transcriptional regulator
VVAQSAEVQRVARPRPDPKFLAQLYARPGFLLRRAHQRNSAIFDAEFRKWDITHTQYGLLMAIAGFPEVDVVRCGRLTGVDRTTSHLAIRNLERHGWIARRTDPSDARRHLVAVTASGIALLQRTKPALQRVKKRLLAALSPAEAALLLALLMRVADADATAPD